MKPRKSDSQHGPFDQGQHRQQHDDTSFEGNFFKNFYFSQGDYTMAKREEATEEKKAIVRNNDCKEAEDVNLTKMGVDRQQQHEERKLDVKEGSAMEVTPNHKEELSEKKETKTKLDTDPEVNDVSEEAAKGGSEQTQGGHPEAKEATAAKLTEEVVSEQDGDIELYDRKYAHDQTSPAPEDFSPPLNIPSTFDKSEDKLLLKKSWSEEANLSAIMQSHKIATSSSEQDVTDEYHNDLGLSMEHGVSPPGDEFDVEKVVGSLDHSREDVLRSFEAPKDLDSMLRSKTASCSKKSSTQNDNTDNEERAWKSITHCKSDLQGWKM